MRTLWPILRLLSKGALRRRASHKEALHKRQLWLLFIVGMCASAFVVRKFVGFSCLFFLSCVLFAKMDTIFMVLSYR